VASALRPRRPRLFFKRACPPCALTSRLAVILSIGTIERVALESAEARAFYARHPGLEGMPLLIDGHRVVAGAAVFRALPAVVIAQWSRALRVRTTP
jgi:hypothetical protein